MAGVIVVYCIIVVSQSSYLVYTHFLLKFGKKYLATILYEDSIFTIPAPKSAWVIQIETEEGDIKCFLFDDAKPYKVGDHLEVYRWNNFPSGAYDAVTLERPKRVRRCIKKTAIYTLLLSCLYTIIYVIVKSFV